MNDIVYLGSKDNFMLLPTSFLRAIAINYPTPSSLSGLWNFGVSAFVFLAIQVFTGILLVTNYIPYIGLAAASIEHTMRDVYMGWLLRYIHISGASFYFFALYTHIARGLNYSSYSYPRANAWFSGILIFYISMLVAFSGYILPWGQMSFWAATVITNLLTIFPNGEGLVTWVWGSPTISTITLSRFFTIHFISPFILIFIVLLHVTFLHTYGSVSTNINTYLSDKCFVGATKKREGFQIWVRGLLLLIGLYLMLRLIGYPIELVIGCVGVGRGGTFRECKGNLLKAVVQYHRFLRRRDLDEANTRIWEDLILTAPIETYMLFCGTWYTEELQEFNKILPAVDQLRNFLLYEKNVSQERANELPQLMDTFAKSIQDIIDKTKGFEDPEYKALVFAVVNRKTLDDFGFGELLNKLSVDFGD